MLKKHFFVFVIFTLIFRAFSGLASAQTASDTLFPETTQGYFEISSIVTLKEQWQKTRIGALVKDPVMQSAAEEIQKQLDAKWVNRLGLTIDDLKLFPQGSISGGMIAIPGTTPGFVLAIGVKDRANETSNFMQRIGEKLESQGVKRATTPIENATATYFTFEKTEQNPNGGTAIYLLTKNTLVITDQKHLASVMVKRLNGELTAPLCEKPAYKAIQERVTRNLEANNEVPLLKWYIEPLEFTAAMRLLSKDNQASAKKGLVQIDAYELLTAHGFKGILGAGGILDLATDSNQLAHRTMAYAPQPRTGAAIEMLSFKNGDDFAPPQWLPDDVARFTVLYIEPQKIFENIGPIFDDIVDEPGVWNEVVKSFREDRFRESVDIQTELADNLGDRLVMLTRFQKPIMPDSSRFVAALSIKSGKDAEVAKALEKLFSGGEDAKKIERNGVIYWQSAPKAAGAADRAISPRTRDRSSIVPSGSSARRTPTTRNSASTTGSAANNEPATVTRELFFDKGAIAVAKGHVFVSNNIEDLYAVLDGEGQTTVTTMQNYETIAQKLARMDAGKGERFLQIFARSDELIMPTYEMVREGKMPQSQTILGAIIRAIITPEEGKAASGAVDFDRSTLPPFEQIKDYFGTAGTVGMVEEDGWLIESVQLP